MSGRRSRTPPTPPERERSRGSWRRIHSPPWLLRRGCRLWNQSGAALSGEIGPEPLPLHPEPVLQLRQRHQMQEDPDEPSDEPAHANTLGLQNREIFADDGHIAL